MASFDNKKELKFIITLLNGTFGSSSNNTITLQGYRAVVDIDKAGGMMMGTLRASIYGVSQSDMNACVAFPYQPKRLASGAKVKLNIIRVFAIDGAQETLIFTGNIINAWGNYQAMPDVFLNIQAISTYASQITPAPPTSYKGGINVATIMSQLANQMGLTFENNGVSVQLSNQYLAGTLLDQVKSLVKAANIDYYIDNGVLAICPLNIARNKPATILSPQTGMIGYPTFDRFGVNVQALFNPAVIFGGTIQVQSDIPQANGSWVVRIVAYKLESEKPGGAWLMAIRGTPGNIFISAASQS